MSRFQIAFMCILGFLTAGYAQWQPLPPEDISLSSVFPAVRADTSRKADGKIVDTDTLAGTVNIEFEGYYRFIPHTWIDSGNEQRNESFYLEMRQGNDVTLPLDPNAGPYKVVADDTVLYAEHDLYVDRDAGLFYLKPGVHEIWMLHYILIADQYPQFIHYYPDGRGMHNAESLYIWDFLVITPEPRVDVALMVNPVPPDYCFAEPDNYSLVPGDTMTVELVLNNIVTDGYRNAFPSGELIATLPAGLSYFDFSLQPQDAYIGRTDSLIWSIDQFSDSTVKDFTVSFKALLPSSAPVPSNYNFKAEFDVANDLDENNNLSSAVVKSTTEKPCPTDCFVQLYSDDTDRIVSAEDAFQYVLVYGNQGDQSADNPSINVSLPSYVNVLNYDPALTRNGNTFSRSFAEFQPGFQDSVVFDVIVIHPVPENISTLTAVGYLYFDLDDNPDNNQSTDNLQIGIGQWADISIIQTIQTDSTRWNNGVIEHWAAHDSLVDITITVKNESPYIAFNLTVSDVLPERVVTTDDTQWSISRLEANDSRQFTITCQVKDSISPDGAPFTNTATVVCSNEREADRANNSSQETFYLYELPSTDIELSYVSITDSTIYYNGHMLPAAVEGETLLFRITVVNSGPDAAENVIIKNVLPYGLEDIQFDNQNYTPGDTLSWIIDQLAPGMAWNVNMFAVYNSVDNRPVLLTGEASAIARWDEDDSNNHATARVVILNGPEPDVVVAQNIISDSVSVVNTMKMNYVTFDQEFKIQLVVHNAGNAAALQAVVHDTLPDGINVISSSPAGSVNGSILTWNFGAIVPGDSSVIELTCVVENDALTSGHVFTNAVGALAENEPPLNQFNNLSRKQFYLYEKYVQPEYDIALSYTAITDSVVDYMNQRLPAVLEGDPFLLSLSATNTGPYAAQNVIVRNVLPPGLSQINFDNTNYTAGDTLVWLINNLAPGETWRVNVSAVYETAENTAVLLSAFAKIQSDWDMNETNNRATTQLVILKKHGCDLSVTQTIETDSVYFDNGKKTNYVKHNDDVTIRIVVRNSCTAAAHNVTIQNSLPAGVSVISVSPSGSADGNTLSWLIGEIAPCDSVVISLTCRVVGTALPDGSIFVNRVDVGAENEPAENQQNNSSQKSYVLYSPKRDTSYDLVISQVVISDSLIEHDGEMIGAVPFGDPVSYQIILRNNGPAPAHNVLVSTNEPNLFTYDQFSKAYQKVDTDYVWTIDSLATGALWIVNYQATYGMLPQLDYFVETTAFVSAPLDSTPGNNSSSTIAVILDSLSCDTWIDVAAETDGEVVNLIEPGQDFDFILDYGNQQDPSENVVIWFLPPQGFEYLGSGPQPDYMSGDTLFWALDLVDGDGHIIINMRAPDDLDPGGYSFTGKAFIHGENEDENTLDDNSSSYIIRMDVEELPELILNIHVNPEQMDVTDSAYVSVSFSQPVQEWDIAVTLPTGQTISSFGDEFINRTIINPETMYEIDQAFRHPKLMNNSEQDDIIFTLYATSVHGVTGKATATLLVTSSNDMHLDRNVFRGDQDDLVEIHFKVAGGSDYSLALYDLAGHLVTIIDENYVQGGWNMVAWDGRRQEDGSFIGSGTYVVTLETQYERYYKKLIIVR